MARPPVRTLRVHLKPHHKLWLNWDGAFLMGPRYLRFLEAVDRTGTIRAAGRDRKSTRLNSSHVAISYAVFCLKKKNKKTNTTKASTKKKTKRQSHTTRCK